MPIQHRIRQWRALPKPHDRAKAINAMPFHQRAQMMGQAMTDSLNSSVLSDQSAASLPGEDSPLSSAEGGTAEDSMPLTSGEQP